MDEIFIRNLAIPIVTLALLKTPWMRRDDSWRLPQVPTSKLTLCRYCTGAYCSIKSSCPLHKTQSPALTLRACIGACCSINYPWPLPKSPPPSPHHSGIHSCLGYSLVLEVPRNYSTIQYLLSQFFATIFAFLFCL